MSMEAIKIPWKVYFFQKLFDNRRTFQKENYLSVGDTLHAYKSVFDQILNKTLLISHYFCKWVCENVIKKKEEEEKKNEVRKVVNDDS